MMSRAVATGRRGAALLAAALAAAGLAAAPASAAGERVQQITDVAGPFVNPFPSCGAYETVTVTLRATEFYDASGELIRIRAHYAYDSVLTGPTGITIPFDAHQNAEFLPSGINTLTGQGPTVRAPGRGVLYQDVGRLVFDDTTGRTLFTSAKAVSFEAFDPARLEAAVCAAVAPD
jgi:hypothetical protein